MQKLKEERERMAVEWKRKKQFDGDTCGLKACSRKASGYLADSRPCSANKNGKLWYGPICEKCSLEHFDKKPDKLEHIWHQRNGLEDMAQLFNVPVEDMRERLTNCGVALDEPIETEAEELEPTQESSSATVVLRYADKQPVLAADREAEELLEAVKVFRIETREDLEAAAGTAMEAKKQRTFFEEEKAKITGPAKKILDATNELFGPVIKRLETIEKILKEKIGLAKDASQEAQQQALLRAQAAATEGNNVAASLAMSESAQSEFVTPSGLGTADVWDFEVINPLEVPRQYTEYSKKLIRAAIRAGERHIPGVRIFRKTQVKIVE